MIWVIDASVAVRWLLKEEEHPHADIVLQSVINYPNFFIVPELFCYEVFRYCAGYTLHLLKPILREYGLLLKAAL